MSTIEALPVDSVFDRAFSILAELSHSESMKTNTGRKLVPMFRVQFLRNHCMHWDCTFNKNTPSTVIRTFYCSLTRTTHNRGVSSCRLLKTGYLARDSAEKNEVWAFNSRLRAQLVYAPRFWPPQREKNQKMPHRKLLEECPTYLLRVRRASRSLWLEYKFPALPPSQLVLFCRF